MRACLYAVWLLTSAGLCHGQDKSEFGRVDFGRDVKPILVDCCFACHGPDVQTREAELRLDVRESAVDRGAIKPGKPDDSKLVKRILHADVDERMPPADFDRPLTATEKETLQRWIAAGANYERHWSLEPPRRPAIPVVQNTAWPHSPIDCFILRRLEREELSPSPEADRVTLIRRVTLDLTGLPATPAEVDAFVCDTQAGAYERLVDRLISTTAYAERRAQDWLDLARYADTRGYADDKMRPIWPFRDWVIRAFDRNMPFDQFTIEQLAGDMLPDASVEQRLASAFHRNAPQAKGQTYPVEEYRVKGILDRVNTTGRVWLGLTMGCAECHDHKFDPVSQQDYYAMFALFNNVEHEGTGFGQGGPHMQYLPRFSEQMVSVPVMEELPNPRETYIHVRGNFLHRGEKVSPDVPAVFAVAKNEQPTDRLEFARWLVNGKNPLVARVVVNRFWQSHFGYGLVRTPDDFGVRGSPATHPELLDWLACEFVDSGWDMKQLHRRIVTSATYRQSARITPELQKRDPKNVLLARMPRVRLPAEQIRDQALAVSGLLVTKVGGPSVFPRQPLNYWQQRALPGEWTDSQGGARYRRTLYTYWRRMALHPSLELLDAPARETCVARREISNVPTQALVLLNDPIFSGAARALAARLIREVDSADEARLQRAFRLVVGRPPRDDERARFLAFVVRERADVQEDQAASAVQAGSTEAVAREAGDSVDQAVWTLACSVLLNLDEAITRP